MPLSVSFSAESVAGSPESVLFTDLSTGSDSASVSRRIYVSDTNGDFIVESGTSTEYEVWAYPLATPITLDLFTVSDKAVKIVCQWLDVSNVVLYDYTIDAIGFTEWNEEFLYGQTQLMTANPLLINDNNFWDNYTKVRTLIDAGNKAILFAEDLYNAQLCYDAATQIRDESQYYFNGNA